MAAVGAVLLAVIVVEYWDIPNDSYAYWLAAKRLVAGEPIYVLGEAAFEPYAYHYPPPLAQALAPLTLVMPDIGYVIAFRALMIAALWLLAGRRMLWTLALIVLLPVALDLRYENVHILLGALLMLGLARWPWLIAIGALIQISPGLGLIYLAARRRWRSVIVASAVGGVIVAASLMLDPGLWQAWLASIGDRASQVGNSLIPVPYMARALLGATLALIGGFIGGRRGEVLLVVAVTLAMPGLALNGFAVLAALAVLWWAGASGIEADHEAERS